MLVPVTGECLCLGYRKLWELKAKVSTRWTFPVKFPALFFQAWLFLHQAQLTTASSPADRFYSAGGGAHQWDDNDSGAGTPSWTEAVSGPRAHRRRKDALSDRQELGV